jgi:hypothetical protein
VLVKDGKYWLEKLADTLTVLAEWIAVHRYEGAPDLDDRIGDAWLSVVEAANRFEPRPGQDSVGYFLNYVLRRVAGDVRRGATVAKRWADEAAVYSDVAPDWLDGSDSRDLAEALGVSLYERQDGPETAGEHLWVSKSGVVYDTTEVIERLVREFPDKAAKLLGVPQDEHLPVRILQVLTEAAEMATALPAWLQEPAPPEPAVTGKLDDVIVRRRRGNQVVEEVLTGDELAEAVNEASANGAIWFSDEAPFDERPDRDGPVKAMVEDRRAVPYRLENFIATQIGPALREWAEGLAELALPVSVGSGVGIQITQVLERLADLMADCDLEYQAEQATVDAVTEEIITVTGDEFGVVRKLVAKRMGVMSDWFDMPEREDSETLRQRVWGWLDKLTALAVTREDVQEAHRRGERVQVHVWRSQAEAIRAIVLTGASPQEARAIEQRAYAVA